MAEPGNDKLSVEVGIGDARTSDRLHVVDLLCSVGKRCSGEVIDISDTGVRIRYSGAKRYQIDDSVGLALRRHDVLLLVRGKVIWEKPLDHCHRVAGFQFEQLSEDETQTLRELMSRTIDSIEVRKTA